jgi:putative restriction endonuclease
MQSRKIVSMPINRWTEEQTKRALYLYFQLPFGQLHSGNPEIIALARAVGRTPSSIAMKLANFASLDPKIVESGRKGLDGASALDRRIWAEFNSDWTRLIMEAEELGGVSATVENTLKDRSANFVHEQPFVGPTTVTVMIEQRVGQDFFRRAVLANYDNQCCITGIADPRLLNASHIMPWKIDVKNRHNPRNGLCLSATFDRAFDRGLMSVDQEGRANFSPSLLESSSAATRSYFQPYHGKTLLAPKRFDPDPSFLAWHHTRYLEGTERRV